jgi:hypothetical protein
MSKPCSPGGPAPPLRPPTLSMSRWTIFSSCRELVAMTNRFTARSAYRARADQLFSSLVAFAPTIALASLLSGCYAGIGPTVGIVTSSGTPTVGWELSGFTAAVGQSYAVQRASERPWRVRTYVAWEPRVGRPTRDLSGISSEAFGFAGLGGTLGAHWETVDDAAAPPRAHFLGGVWLGGGYAFPVNAPSCGGNWRPYLSLAIGFRADEIYFSPKFGALEIPGFCLNIGFN